jgi:adenosylhomocysteinase
MYDFRLIEKARTSEITSSMPFLAKQREEVQDTKPYDGLRILHNIPLTLSTVFKIEALALGGADVTVVAPKLFPVEKKAADLLKQANFRVLSERNFTSAFDIHLDCCAELIKLHPPKIGAVELTQSGSKIYQEANLEYPIVSVDDSKLKVLETFFGTGDGFSRALYQLVGDEKKQKSFVIFGHGKVGKGILYAIQQFSDDITVIDVLESFADKKPGIKYVDARNKSQVAEAIAGCYCAITATGIKNLITDYYSFTKAHFGNSILINMGAEDEYGVNFELNDVEFNKQPFNFSLAEPTSFHYLDPIFYAHNAGIDLILSKQVNKEYNAFPDKLALNILEKWQAIYNEDLQEALLSF